MTTIDKGLFPLGQTVMTPGAIEVLEGTAESPGDFIARHQSGDWGEVCADDAQANQEALHQGFRLMSVYRTAEGKKLWVITEADRSVTTLLLPEEY